MCLCPNLFLQGHQSHRCLLKGAQRESCRLFYLGQNEDCSLGDSPSDSPESLLQRGSGARSRYKILVKGEFDAIKPLFYKRLSASQEELMSSRRGLVLF